MVVVKSMLLYQLTVTFDCPLIIVDSKLLKLKLAVEPPGIVEHNVALVDVTVGVRLTVNAIAMLL